jgi:2-dehydro-3-deoxygluconokinase
VAAALSGIAQVNLKIKTTAETRRDLIALGEILLRFCPGDAPIQRARAFDVFDGGGEYNVAKNLAQCFRRRTSILTALADNAVGRLAENLARGAGVDVSNVVWRDAADWRNGLYFIERGFGWRAPNSVFDRENTAVSGLKPDEIEWSEIFGQTRWFHTGGIFAGLSEKTPAVALAAMRAARAAGTFVSFDLNYRDSLWRKKGGRDAANRLNRELLPFADAVFGVFDFDARLANFDLGEFQTRAAAMKKDFPNLKIIASVLRAVHTANRHSLGAVCFTEEGIFQSKIYENADVFDRVGSGDAFASGLIYGCLQNESAQFAVECGAAAAVLAMTTPGDNLAVTLGEIENLMRGGAAHARR